MYDYRNATAIICKKKSIHNSMHTITVICRNKYFIRSYKNK